jgi:hypothetical protein
MPQGAYERGIRTKSSLVVARILTWSSFFRTLINHEYTKESISIWFMSHEPFRPVQKLTFQFQETAASSRVIFQGGEEKRNLED